MACAMPSIPTNTDYEGGVALLTIRGLRTHIPTRRGTLRAVDGVDLSIDAGETVGLVGESGCGKTMAAYSILGLVPRPAEVVGGEILFEGEDLRRKSPEQLRTLRGSAISMVFQEPLTALNPLFPVGTQIGDVLLQHMPLSRRAVRDRIRELLAHVGIPAPEHVARAYPFQLSGGMRQRVLIAMAIACGPRLVIADEPTTALDTTIQAQILDLLRQLVEENHIALLLITHDLGVVAEMCQRVYVMYAGKIVEHAVVGDLFASSLHPYSNALLRCTPALADADRELESVEGVVPDMIGPTDHCAFGDRCRYVVARCRAEPPVLRSITAGHDAACHFAGDLVLPQPEPVAPRVMLSPGLTP